MIYLDTNVIIYAIENHPKYGAPCAKILLDVQNEKLKVCSSMLVLIETINVLIKINRTLKGKQLNVRDNVDAILSLPITWLDLNFSVIRRAAEYDYRISGVDYAHVATMEINGIKKIVSADEELDRVNLIKRVDPLKY